MRFRSALSTAPDVDAACAECARSILVDDVENPPDFVLAFASPKLGHIDRVAPVLSKVLAPKQLAGCSGGGVLAEGREIETRAGLAVIAGWLPGVHIRVRHLRRDELPDGDAAPSSWHDLIEATPDRVRGIAVFPDPWSFPVASLLEGLDYAYPRAPKFGGLVSGGDGPTQQHLYLDDQSLESGAIVVAFLDEIRIQTVVAQGCRPIGRAGTVTDGAGQNLVRVDGLSALDFLQQQIDSLDDAGVEAVRRSTMFIGLAMDPFALDAPHDGEYLMRNIVGLDRARGSLAIAGRPAIGRKVRFHLRDAEASELDLQRSLEKVDRADPTAGALLFSCVGRGRHMYGHADHDSRAFRAAVGEVPLAGFFCNGEIGPVGGHTHLHGYTSAFALFRPASKPAAR